MGKIPSVSEWQDKKTQSIAMDEFFLKESEHKDMYEKVNELYQKNVNNPVLKEKFPKPIEQLSPKGLALLSYHYAIKDGNMRQPVIASTSEDLYHVARLMTEAPAGTEITIIFQPTVPIRSTIWAFPPQHKTVIKLERTESDLNVVLMDSSTNKTYSRFCCYSLMGNAFKHVQKKAINFNYYFQEDPQNPNSKNPNKPDSFSRQIDSYQCGVFACKDARFLNRENQVTRKLKSRPMIDCDIGDHKMFSYEFFPESFKGIQSKIYSDYALKAHGNKVVTRKGKTLEQTYEKHKVYGYIYHFSKKFHDNITHLIKKHKDHPEVIRAAVEQYDAGKLSLKKLIEIYGPHTNQVLTAWKQKEAENKKEEGDKTATISAPKAK